MESRHQKLLALLFIAMYCIVNVYFAIVSAMNGDYLVMAIVIIVFCGIGMLIVACGLTRNQDTGDEPGDEPIPQTTPGPAGDCIV